MTRPIRVSAQAQNLCKSQHLRRFQATPWLHCEAGHSRIFRFGPQNKTQGENLPATLTLTESSRSVLQDANKASSESVCAFRSGSTETAAQERMVTSADCAKQRAIQKSFELQLAKILKDFSWLKRAENT